MSVSDLVGRKFKAVRFLDDEPSALYGLPLGTVITVCHVPVTNAHDAIWMRVDEHSAKLYDGNWGSYEHLCIANDPVEFHNCFEEIL